MSTRHFEENLQLNFFKTKIILKNYYVLKPTALQRCITTTIYNRKRSRVRSCAPRSHLPGTFVK